MILLYSFAKRREAGISGLGDEEWNSWELKKVEFGEFDSYLWRGGRVANSPYR
jgi:hypothetical protein